MMHDGRSRHRRTALDDGAIDAPPLLLAASLDSAWRPSLTPAAVLAVLAAL